MLGSRGTETGKKLFKEVDIASPFCFFMTDYWKAYEEMIPAQRHYQSKKETYTVEGYNSRLRHFLARLRRKSKCYSKAEQMLKYSLLLLMEKLNGNLSILI